MNRRNNSTLLKFFNIVYVLHIYGTFHKLFSTFCEYAFQIDRVANMDENGTPFEHCPKNRLYLPDDASDCQTYCFKILQKIMTDEVNDALKSSIIATSAMNRVHKQITDFITTIQVQEIDYSVLSKLLLNFLEAYSKRKIFEGDSPGDMKLWCEPKIHGEYIKLDSKTNDEKWRLGFDVFLCHCQIGIGYKNQCIHYARPLMINPTNEMKENYHFMMLVEVKLLETLKSGVCLSEVYKTVITYAKQINLDKSKNLKREFGCLLDSNGKDTSFAIKSSTEHIAQENTIFVISIELISIAENGREYSLYNNDSVLVRKDGPARILTLYRNKHHKFIVENIIDNKSK